MSNGPSRGWDFPPANEDVEEIESRTHSAESLARQGSYLPAAAQVNPARRLVDTLLTLPALDLQSGAHTKYVASQTYVTAGNIWRQIAANNYLENREMAAPLDQLDEADRLLRIAVRTGQQALMGTAFASEETRRRAELQYGYAELKLAQAGLARVIMQRDRPALAAARTHLAAARTRFEEWGDAVGYVDSRTLDELMRYYSFTRPISGFTARTFGTIRSLWRDIQRVAPRDPQHVNAARRLAARRIRLLFVPRQAAERAILLDY